MKKEYIIKPLVVIIALFSLLNATMCSGEETPVDLVLENDFEETFNFTGYASVSSFSESGTVNLSEFIDVNSLKETNIESATLTLLDDYSGDSFNLNINLTAGPDNVTVLNQDVTLVKGVPYQYDLVPALNIVELLSANNILSYSITGTSENPIGDDDFSLKVLLKISGEVAPN